MEYIKRLIDSDLEEWSKSDNRKPLLLRGARQVGKSSSIRELGKKFEYFLEIDLEKRGNRVAKQLFEKDISVKQLCEELSVVYDTPIIPGKTLLFIDEIQSSLPAISTLRYFYEEMPELHVCAAGSLLEFALEEIPSFGVGRIRSMFMYPFSFEEFLSAQKKVMLLEKMQSGSPENPISDSLHSILTKELITFIIIGGMPEVVSTYIQTNSLLKCQQVLDDFIFSLDDDFAKYKNKVPTSRIRDIFESVMAQMGNKYVHSKALEYANRNQIKDTLRLLELAGLIYPVTHSSANGLPLSAEKNPQYTRYLVFDTGVFNRFLQMDISDILVGTTLDKINKGNIAELFAGIEIIKSFPNNTKTDLFYWQREARNSNAQVDYLLASPKDIMPLEIKSGTKGSMQSLYLFLEEKKSPYGIRSSLENYGLLRVGSAKSEVKIVPLYALSSFYKTRVYTM